jgi:hypothetical protein
LTVGNGTTNFPSMNTGIIQLLITLIIFKMDDDGRALRVGAKYKSFTDLECALRKFQEDNYETSFSMHQILFE